jgi:hypothetical protein
MHIYSIVNVFFTTHINFYHILVHAHVVYHLK